ncbi:MAG: HIRAN domain-containing protein [Myxococcaceae bacterium]
MAIPKGKQIKLSKSQQLTAEGLELMQLLQTITADGKFTPDEVVELVKWLRRNKTSDLPAIKFLTETVEAVIADGKVSREEQETLYKALERVLPKELSEIANENREGIREKNKQKLKDSKEDEREQKQDQQAQARAERKLNVVVDDFNFMVAGTKHDGRSERIAAHANEGDQVLVLREPKNPFSKNACRLFLLNNQIEIGYVPENSNFRDGVAASLSELLDDGCKYQAYVSKMLTAGYSPIPVVIIKVFAPGSTIPDLRTAEVYRDGKIWVSKSGSKSNKENAQSGTGCLIGLVLFPLLGSFMALLLLKSASLI